MGEFVNPFGSVLDVLHADANSRPDAGVLPAELPIAGEPNSPDAEWEGGLLSEPVMRVMTSMVLNTMAGVIIGQRIAAGLALRGEMKISHLPRVGSGLKVDFVKPVRDARGNIVKEFPTKPMAHGFPNVVDNFAGSARSFGLRNGAMLYQVEGSLNGVAGRFEWIVDGGAVTHRMFVGGGTVNGVPIVQ
jgi:hypothetical protein